MKVNKREVARWLCLFGYVLFSFLIWATRLMVRNVPVSIVLFLFLTCLLLMGFKLIEGSGKPKSSEED